MSFYLQETFHYGKMSRNDTDWTDGKFFIEFVELWWATYLKADQVTICSSSHMVCNPNLCCLNGINYSVALGYIYQLLFLVRWVSIGLMINHPGVTFSGLFTTRSAQAFGPRSRGS